MQERIVELIRTINSLRVTNAQRREAQKALDLLTSQVDWRVLFELLSFPGLIAVGGGLDQGLVIPVRLYALNTLRQTLADTAGMLDDSTTSNSFGGIAEFQAKLFAFIDSSSDDDDSNSSSSSSSSILIEKTGELLCYLLLAQSQPFHQYLMDSMTALSQSVSTSSSVQTKHLICLACIKELGDWSRENLFGISSDSTASNSAATNATNATNSSNSGSSHEAIKRRKTLKGLMQSLANQVTPPLYHVYTTLSAGSPTNSHQHNHILLKLSVAALSSLIDYTSVSTVGALSPSICDFLPSIIESSLSNTGLAIYDNQSFTAASTELFCMVLKLCCAATNPQPMNSNSSLPNEPFVNWLSSVGIVALNNLISKSLLGREYGIGLLREIMETVVDIGATVICHQKRPIIPANFATFLKILLEWLMFPNLMSSVIAIPFWINFCKHDFFIQNASKIGIPFKVICETLLKSCYEKLVSLPESIPSREFYNRSDFEDAVEYNTFTNFYRSKHLDLVKVIFDHCDCSDFVMGLCQQKNSLMEGVSARESQVFLYFIDVTSSSSCGSNSSGQKKGNNDNDKENRYLKIHSEILKMCLTENASAIVTEKQLNLIDTLRKIIVTSDQLLHATLSKIFSLMTGPSTEAEWIAVRRLCCSILVHLSTAAPKDSYPFRALLPGFIFPYLEIMITKCTELSTQTLSPEMVANLITLRSQTLQSIGLNDFGGPLCSMHEQASLIEWFILLLNDPMLDKSQSTTWISGVTVPIYREFCEYAAGSFGPNVGQPDFQALCDSNKGFRVWLSLKSSVLSKIWLRVDASVPTFCQESMDAFLELLQANKKLSAFNVRKETAQWYSIVRQGIFRAIHLWIEKWGVLLVTGEARFPSIWQDCVVEPFICQKSFDSIAYWKPFFQGLVSSWWIKGSDAVYGWLITWVPGLLLHACTTLNELSLVGVNEIDSVEGVSEESLDKHIETKMLSASRTLCTFFYPDFTTLYVKTAGVKDFALYAGITGMLSLLQKSHIDGLSYQRLFQGLQALVGQCGTDLVSLKYFLDSFVFNDRQCNVLSGLLDRGWRDVSKRDTYQAALVTLFTTLYGNLVAAVGGSGGNFEAEQLLNNFQDVICNSASLVANLDVSAEKRQAAMAKMHQGFLRDAAQPFKQRNHVRVFLDIIFPADMGSASRNASAANLKVPKIYSEMYSQQQALQDELKRKQQQQEDSFLGDLDSFLYSTQ